MKQKHSCNSFCEEKKDVHAKWLTRERLAQGRKLKGK